MKKFSFNKLVRDNVIQQMIDNNISPKRRILGDEEYKGELIKKLKEEANEIATTSSPEGLLEELADIQDVIDTILSVLKKTRQDLYIYQQRKTIKMGALDKRHYVADIELEATNPRVQYYKANSEKYPELLDNNDS